MSIQATDFDDWLLSGKQLFSYYKADSLMLIDRYGPGFSMSFHPATEEDLENFIRSIFKAHDIEWRNPPKGKYAIPSGVKP